MAFARGIACVFSLALCAGAAMGQAFPTKPIRFIAPFPAGGSSDLIARVLSQRMGAQLAQPVVIDNRPGASGSLGTEIAAKAPADGYTLVLGGVAPMAMNPHLLKRVGYDPIRDFAIVSSLARGPQLLVVHPSLCARTVQEFLALARRKPNALICGSGGVGTPAHIGCELLRLRGNAQLLHVPYKGTGQSVNDLLGAQIHSVFASMPVCYPHVRAGRLRALATSSRARTALAPDLPTMLKAGVADFITESWWGAYVPSGTPDAVVRKLSEVIGKILPERETKERFTGLGIEPFIMASGEFGALMRSELEHYGRVVRDVGIASQ
jgi:tripartite-type tricarboxylate transporter receptor subunit TctC